jgi:hypothetical protein
MSERLFVDVPDADSAIGLVEELKNLHAELVPTAAARSRSSSETSANGRFSQRWKRSSAGWQAAASKRRE